MILVIGGIKGGSGKTTLATNLAVIRSGHRKKVLLVDADDQRSTSDWVEQRMNLGIDTPWVTIQLVGEKIHTQLKKLQGDFDDIIVDTGGRDTRSQRSALFAADKFLTPFQPRSLDVWTVGSVITLVSEIKTFNQNLKAYAVINRADAQGTDNFEAADILKEHQGIEYLNCSIGQRKAFANAAAEGLSVVEMKKPDAKALLEVMDLADALF